MSGILDWRSVHSFWFPPGLNDADATFHDQMVRWWFGGGANAELVPFAPALEAARAGALEQWSVTPLGRLALILVLDQFPRGLAAGTPAAFASDQHALRLAEAGLRAGHYDALAGPWEKTFFFMPLVHAEGANHRRRLEQVVDLADAVALAAPPHLRPFFRFGASQARGHLEVISRFGRFPHRNSVLGRVSSPEETAYLAKGDFVHNRQPPRFARAPVRADEPPLSASPGG